MERIHIYLDDQHVGTITCRQCGASRAINVRQECPRVLTIVGAKMATITCRCGAIFQAHFDLRRHPRKAVQLQGTLLDPQACTTLSAIVISSLSVQGLSFRLATNLRLHIGESYTTSFCLDDAEQSRIHERILIRHLQGATVGAEFYAAEQYNYALDFYVYGSHLLPPPRPVRIRLQQPHETAARQRPLGQAQRSAPVAL